MTALKENNRSHEADTGEDSQDLACPWGMAGLSGAEQSVQSGPHISCPVDAGTSLRTRNQFVLLPRSTKAASTMWRRDPSASVILSEPERWRFLSCPRGCTASTFNH